MTAQQTRLGNSELQIMRSSIWRVGHLMHASTRHRGQHGFAILVWRPRTLCGGVRNKGAARQNSQPMGLYTYSQIAGPVGWGLAPSASIATCRSARGAARRSMIVASHAVAKTRGLAQGCREAAGEKCTARTSVTRSTSGISTEACVPSQLLRSR